MKYVIFRSIRESIRITKNSGNRSACSDAVVRVYIPKNNHHKQARNPGVYLRSGTIRTKQKGEEGSTVLALLIALLLALLTDTFFSQLLY